MIVFFFQKVKEQLCIEKRNADAAAKGILN